MSSLQPAPPNKRRRLSPPPPPPLRAFHSQDAAVNPPTHSKILQSAQLSCPRSDPCHNVPLATQSSSSAFILNRPEQSTRATLLTTPSPLPPITGPVLPLSSASLDRLQETSPSTVRVDSPSQSGSEGVHEESIGQVSEELEDQVQESNEESEEGSEEGSQSTSTMSKVTMDQLTALQVRSILKHNRLFIDDDKAREIGNALIKKAMRVLDQKRGSDYGAPKAQEVKTAIKAYANENEATFVMNLHRHLFGLARKVSVSTSLTAEELESERRWLEREWDKDHLRGRFEIAFASDSVPKVEAGSEYATKMLQQVSRISTPKPDIAWGVYETAFTEVQQALLRNLGCAMAGPDLYNIFFVLEAKCMNGSIQDAENQCCRSGAAMVQNLRAFDRFVASKLPASSAPISNPNVDIDTFAYSLAIVPDRASLFVHWCLEDATKGITWHMHFLRTYSFRSTDELTMLHHDLDNVLDWGIGPRKDKVVKALERLEALQVVVPKCSPQKRKAAQICEDEAKLG